jgi:hypothetical protein
MAKLIAQVGTVTVMLRDDRASLSGKALKEWKAAAADLIEGAVGLMTEEVDDGE